MFSKFLLNYLAGCRVEACFRGEVFEGGDWNLSFQWLFGNNFSVTLLTVVSHNTFMYFFFNLLLKPLFKIVGLHAFSPFSGYTEEWMLTDFPHISPQSTDHSLSFPKGVWIVCFCCCFFRKLYMTCNLIFDVFKIHLEN